MRSAVLHAPGRPGSPAPLFRHRAAVRAQRAPLAYPALLFLLMLLYANVAMWIPGLDVLRPTQLTVIVALGLLLYEGTSGRRRLELTWPEGYCFLAFLLACAFSSCTALWPGFAVTTTIELAKALVVYLLVSLTLDDLDRLKRAFWMLMIGGFFPALGTLQAYRTGQMSDGRAAWIGVFGNPNDAAYGLVILLPIVYAVGALGGWRTRFVAVLAALTYTGAIFTTFSRGGLLGFFAVLILTVLRVPSNAMRMGAVFMMGLAVVGMTYFWTRPDSVGTTGLGASETVDQRVITMKAGLEMFADYPLLGVGPGCSVIGFEIYAPHNYLTQKSLIVHNTMVQALAETGVLGTLPYLALIATSLLGAHRLAGRRRGAGPRERQRAVLGAALEASIVGFLVCGLGGGYVMSWFPYILFGLVSAARRIDVSADEVEAGAAA
jgi:O-antigen ligase